MQSAIIRQKFIQYFQDRGHQRVPSSPLVPAGDPTLLFTNAGMVQFKEVFLGQDQRSYRRAVSVQKCMRAGGKHNDLDQVGRTARHQTFFEMLGNFSFGDYFKREAISLAWTFLTEDLGLEQDKLWVTVFETDGEAYELWKEFVNSDRIVRMGEKDNFWSMGETGPCGPCSEIFVDRGLKYACGPDCGLGRCDCDRIQEIWNLVFMQYDRDVHGNLTPLPKPSIDTGMGLERIAAYLQGVDSNFDTDLLFPLIQEVSRLTKKPYHSGSEGMAFRVIADHIRAVTFLVAEGVSFSNEGRGYVMRRILRRAVRYGMTLGLDEPFLFKLVPIVGDIMGGAYPELLSGQSTISQLIHDEEERFFLTLSAGMKVLEEKLDQLKAGQTMAGEDAFLLYDTFGFPLDLTQDAAEERGIHVDHEAFDRAMAEQRRRARANRGKAGVILPDVGPSEFRGYEHLEMPCQVGILFLGPDRVERLETGESGWLWMKETPFYPEGGGQVGDAGLVESGTGLFRVEDTLKSQGAIWHYGTVEKGVLQAGQKGRALVDRAKREGAMRNHTATHLLHAALREVLGGGVHQTGSLVSPERLRFDFSYGSPLSPDQIQRIEDLVNQWILDDRAVSTDLVDKETALSRGALAFFGDKYGETVRVVSIPGASQELCGGTHCRHTGQIGLFSVIQETSVGSGVRRVEAVTGFNALRHVRQLQAVTGKMLDVFKGTTMDNVTERAEELQAQVKRMETSLADAARREKEAAGRELARQALQVGSWSVLVAEAQAGSMEELRQVLDGAKPLVAGAVLAARHDDRASLLVYLGGELREQGLRANDVVRQLAPIIHGGGGGRPDMAQAGGKHPEGISDLLSKARKLVSQGIIVEG